MFQPAHKIPYFENTGFWKFKTLKILDFGNSKFWKHWFLEIPDFENTGFWKYWILKIPDFEILRFRKYWIWQISISQIFLKFLRLFRKFWQTLKNFWQIFRENISLARFVFIAIDRSRWELFKNMFFFPYLDFFVEFWLGNLFFPFFSLFFSLFFAGPWKNSLELEGAIYFLFFTHW